MKNLDILVKSGAEVVAGSVVKDHKHLGNLRDGDLMLSDDGRAELEALAKPARKPAKAAAKKDEATAADTTGNLFDESLLDV